MLEKLSVKKPYTVLVGVVLVIVLGVVSIMKMTTDLLPDMNLPYALIITTYVGASPEEVEKDVTAPVEAQMATTSNIKSITSMSYNSYSVVILEYEQTANMDSIVIEMQQKLDQLKSGWSSSVGSPTIMQIDPSMLPIMVASADVAGMSQIDISQFVENTLKPQLESVEGVASVSTVGSVEERIEVTLDQEKIDKINEDIEASIEDQFEEARQTIKDSKKELEDGIDEFNDKKADFASQIAEGANELVNGKIDAKVGASELSDAKKELGSNKTTLEGAIKSLDKVYKQAKDLKTKRDGLQQLIDAFNQSGYPAEFFPQFAQSAGLVDEAGNGLSLAAVQAMIAQIDAGLAEINKGLASQGAAFADAGVKLTTWEDIPAAKVKLKAALSKINEGMNQMDDMQNKISEGQDTMNDAYVTLIKSEITAILEMSAASSQLTTAAAQLEAGEAQLNAAEESAKDAADMNKILTVEMLSQILMAQNFEMPAGYIQEGTTQYLVSVGDEVTTVDDFRNVILVDTGLDGIEPIYLKDIASVEVVDNAQDSYSRVNGNPAIMLTIEKQTGYSTGDVTDRLLEEFDILEEENENLNMAVLMNQGVYIDMIVESVIQNILIGAALAILVLILFLKDFRSTFIIACSIPLSVILAIVLMYFSNITLNIISLSGLALGIGMLVDNSIVVIENIYRMRKEENFSVKKAAVEGTKQVGGAIVASTITTVCVFAPIIFTTGITKQLFVDLALTVTYTLGASLLVALTFVPMMSSVFLKEGSEKPTPLFDKIKNGYGKLVAGVLRFKPIVLIVTVVLLVVSVWASLSKGFTFMDMDMEIDQISMSVGNLDDQEMTEEQLMDMCDKVTERIIGIEGIETIGVMTGGGSTLSLLGGSEGATYYILLNENTKRSTKEISDEIIAKTMDLECKVDITTASADYTSLLGSGLTIQVKGRDLDKIKEIASQVAEITAATEGCINVSDGMDDTTPTLVIHVDKEKAMEYKLTTAQVFQLIYARMADTNAATELSTDTKDMSVYIRDEDQLETTIMDLYRITFPYTDDKGNEKEVKLNTLVSFETGETLNVIHRNAQKKTISVSAGIDENHNVTKVSSALKKELDKIELPEGYSIEMTGEDEMIYDAMEQLVLMLILAVIFIYLVMVAQFQSLLSPFIIMFTIPLAFTGGFFALFFTGTEVSVIAMIGFVMLAGIIVNNGIVMVDYINQLRREGMDKKEAISTAAASRLRPILMTVLTTVISMSTMALGIGDGSEMMKPMAITMIGGLVYGTILTLVVVPCIYDMFNSNKSMVEEEL